MPTAADKRRLLVAAGFECPGSAGPPFERRWFVPRAFCPELGTTGLDGRTTGKMLPFDEAWRRYEQNNGVST